MITPLTPVPCFPQVISACQRTLKSFGAEKLAQLLGKNTTVLRNEINPNQHGHKLSLLDALRMMQLTGDVQILSAFAGELNYSIYFLGDYHGASDVELLNCYSHWHAEIGDVCRAFSDSLADGNIQWAEVALIEKEIRESFGAALELLERLRAIAVD